MHSHKVSQCHEEYTALASLELHKNTGPRAEIWSETAASSDPLLLGPLSSKRRTLPLKENPFDIKILLEAFLVVKPKTANRLASTSPLPPTGTSASMTDILPVNLLQVWCRCLVAQMLAPRDAHFQASAPRNHP